MSVREKLGFIFGVAGLAALLAGGVFATQQVNPDEKAACCAGHSEKAGDDCCANCEKGDKDCCGGECACGQGKDACCTGDKACCGEKGSGAKCTKGEHGSGGCCGKGGHAGHGDHTEKK